MPDTGGTMYSELLGKWRGGEAGTLPEQARTALASLEPDELEALAAELDLGAALSRTAADPDQGDGKPDDDKDKGNGDQGDGKPGDGKPADGKKGDQGDQGDGKPDGDKGDDGQKTAGASPAGSTKPVRSLREAMDLGGTEPAGTGTTLGDAQTIHFTSQNKAAGTTQPGAPKTAAAGSDNPADNSAGGPQQQPDAAFGVQRRTEQDAADAAAEARSALPGVSLGWGGATTPGLAEGGDYAASPGMASAFARVRAQLQQPQMLQEEIEARAHVRAGQLLKEALDVVDAVAQDIGQVFGVSPDDPDVYTLASHIAIEARDQETGDQAILARAHELVAEAYQAARGQLDGETASTIEMTGDSVTDADPQTQAAYREAIDLTKRAILEG